MSEPSVRKVAAWIPISREIWEEIDRMNNPWRYPDRPAIRSIDPFPTYTRVWAGWFEARKRLAAAWDAIRYGVEENDPW